MAVRVRTVVWVLLVLAAAGLLALITFVGWQVVLGPRARPVTGRTFASTPERLERGRYLVEGVASCFHCHSEHVTSDPEYPIVDGQTGAGWHMPVPELGEIYAPNITPDKETGIGAWTDDEIARAIQEGVSRDGHALFPLMPYMSFRHLTDEDLASVVVYLRSIPAVHHVVPRTRRIAPLNILVKTMPLPLTTPEPPPQTTDVEKGQYLVTIASCAHCHSTMDEHGNFLPHMDYAGGNVFHPLEDPAKTIVSVNITPDPSGIAHYDDDLFIQTLHTGRLPGRMLSFIMPFENFRNLTDDDLRAMFAYLKTVPPVKHRVSNNDPPTACPLDGQMHGLGNLNQKKP